MTYEIGFVLVLLLLALVFFVSEKLRMDLVALMVLAILAVSGMVTVDQALAGFSNPAVVTVWAMFILSAGLSATGVADLLGQKMLSIAGETEPRIILTVMLVTGMMSAFMNNVGVASLMLPVVMDIARRTGVSPSRLLMPMAYASLLGGLTTLIGTPPNLVASTALEQAGFEPFGLFAFAPVGIPSLILGSLFIAYLGRHLLPKGEPKLYGESRRTAGSMLRFDYEMESKKFQLTVGDNSPVVGDNLEKLGLGAVLGLSVYAVKRGGAVISDVDGTFVLQAGDVLLIHGSIDEFRYFMEWRAFELARGAEISELLDLQKVAYLRLFIAATSNLCGQSVQESEFSSRFSGYILSHQRGEDIARDGIGKKVLQAGDCLLVETKEEEVDAYRRSACFDRVIRIEGKALQQVYAPDQTLFELQIPEWSHFAGRKISQTRVSEVLGIRVVGIARRSGSNFHPVGDDVFQVGDKLLVQGSRETERLLNGLQNLQPSEGHEPGVVSGEELGLLEMTLSPQSQLAGKVIKDMNFRRRYGLQIQAIWRKGEVLSSHLWQESLELGDAILLSGPRDRMQDIAEDDDFLVLSQPLSETDSGKTGTKAAVSLLIMLGVVVLVMLNVLPIAVAAISGVVVMVATRCLNMDQAYRAIEWQSVFLIACMIPMGTAMQTSGAAQWVAEGVAQVASPFGPWGIVIGLYLLTSLATTIVPTTALVLIMAPIAIGAAAEFDVPPQMIMMAVAMAASASFTSPISHPANVMVMGPGGYRFVDYVKMGVLLAIVVMITSLLMIASLSW